MRILRRTLEELGPTFAKLGQILSTRPDLLPQSVIAELATLHDRVAPLSELATAELDPFAVAGTFMLKRLVGSARGTENAGALMYQFEKARARATRLLESIEGLTGARPGYKLRSTCRA